MRAGVMMETSEVWQILVTVLDIKGGNVQNKLHSRVSPFMNRLSCWAFHKVKNVLRQDTRQRPQRAMRNNPRCLKMSIFSWLDPCQPLMGPAGPQFWQPLKLKSAGTQHVRLPQRSVKQLLTDGQGTRSAQSKCRFHLVLLLLWRFLVSSKTQQCNYSWNDETIRPSHFLSPLRPERREGGRISSCSQFNQGMWIKS